VRSQLTVWSKQAALFRCGFRPFFLLTSLYTVLLGCHYLALIGTQSSDEWALFYQHELVYGIGSALISGFLLTAFPVWTKTQRTSGNDLISMVLLWGLGRLCAWAIIYVGMLPMVMANSVFFIILLSRLLQPIRDNKQQRHRIFYYQLMLYFSVAMVSYYYWFYDDLRMALRWLDVAFGVYVLLMITVLSRMSAVIVNHALRRFEVLNVKHVAKPPRRNFANGLIILYLVVTLVMPQSSVSGWLALSCAAGILNILNDWHLPKVWRDPYVQTAYLFYLLIASGFIVVGCDNIWYQAESYRFIKPLAISALVIAMMVIMLVVGQKHTGRDLEEERGTKVILRLASLAGLLPLAPLLIDEVPNELFVWLSGGLILTYFGLYYGLFWHRLTRARIDNVDG
jgi:uncharacterized protein involved in response to NO